MRKGLAVVLSVLVGVCVFIPCVLYGQVVSSPVNYVAIIRDSELGPLLARYFPDAVLLEVGDEFYQTVSLAEMERFLAQDGTDSMAGTANYYGCYVDDDDYANALLGNMSDTPGWARVPFGIIVRGKCGYGVAVYSNIFVTRENGRLVLYEINPMPDDDPMTDDEIWPILHPQYDVMRVSL